MATQAEENYLKAIFKLSGAVERSVSTNALADALDTKASSVTDMVKKLSDKKWVNYQPYQGVTLSNKGKKMAIQVIRKHRLWEVFLVNQLHFRWDEIHEIAEQLEHIQSDKLIDRLDQFLGFPQFDPHGDPIPTADGKIRHHKDETLKDMNPGDVCEVVGVKAHEADFLQYLDGMNLIPGVRVEVKKRYAYDQSLVISVDQGSDIMVSSTVSRQLLVRKKSQTALAHP